MTSQEFSARCNYAKGRFERSAVCNAPAQALLTARRGRTAPRRPRSRIGDLQVTADRIDRRGARGGWCRLPGTCLNACWEAEYSSSCRFAGIISVARQLFGDVDLDQIVRGERAR